MDNYIVSARKYRPATFRSVIGQQALTTTLKNAILNNKLAHAYLFCGPRGIGKTTCARIFAKTINCSNLTPEGEACNACESCRTFNEQRSYNVHELDGASNNSVEDIRSLIEQVRIPPQIGKYKVYIIDEVHMLSLNAFNAFLKTLEEPPRYAIFILATTEKHKMLPTILSRCQIYDFNRISINDIVDYLVYVAGQESITFEKEGLNVIAQKADGGMRDALSIFDQVVNYTEGNITYQSVIDNLNVLDSEYYFKLTGLILQYNVSSCLLVLNEIMNKGFDGQHIVGGLASFFRDLLVCKDAQTIVLYEIGDVMKDKYLTVSKHCETEFLYKAIELSNECDMAYRTSRNKRLLIELLFIRLCQLNIPQLQENDKKKTLEPIVSQNDPVLTSAQTDITIEKQPKQEEKHSQVTPKVQPDQQIDKPKNTAESVVRVSLKSAKPKKEGDRTALNNTPSEPELSHEPFTQEQLNELWQKYADTINEKIHLKNTMLSNLPELKTADSFTVSVYNPEQAQKLQEESSILLNYLRTALQNTHIIMNVNIAEENSKQLLAYTDREKYELMVSSNPYLKNLAAEFNLRLD